jgi:signal transduction histidine kinase
MHGGSRKLIVIVAFTIILIALVNMAWWLFYDRTEAMLDSQLSRRLLAIAHTAAVPMTPELIENLAVGDFKAYFEVVEILNKARAADSLSEIFIIGEDYSYLASTNAEIDSLYFLAELNSPYIDSIFLGLTERGLATPSHQTGSVFLKSAFAPLTDDDGGVLAVLGVEANVDYFTDLADLRTNLYYSTALSLTGGVLFGILFLLAQRRMNRLQQSLFMNETQAYLGRMVAIVAHEVRNPLMIIRASAERLTKKHHAVESEFIVDEVDRLNQIVTGYLDISKGDTEGSLLKTEKIVPVQINELVASLQKHLRDKYAGHEIEWLGSEIPPGLTIKGYPGPLRQVLLNLLINGADACLGAALPVAIGIEVRPVSDGIELTVTDRGPGMAKRDVARAGELFNTTKQTGSGLGLYLSRKIVVEMGARIDIHSRRGDGTKVVIRLPLKPGNA